MKVFVYRGTEGEQFIYYDDPALTERIRQLANEEIDKRADVMAVINKTQLHTDLMNVHEDGKCHTLTCTVCYPLAPPPSPPEERSCETCTNRDGSWNCIMHSPATCIENGRNKWQPIPHDTSSAEELIEMAREAHSTFQHEIGGGYGIKRIAAIELAEHDAYESAMAALKSERWTDELVDEYARYYLEQYKKSRPVRSARDWLNAKRREERAKFDPDTT